MTFFMIFLRDEGVTAEGSEKILIKSLNVTAYYRLDQLQCLALN